MPSDTVKLQCLYCGHRQTIRLGAGLWWRCKGKPGAKCGKVNPGPTVVGDVMRSAISTGQIIVGKRARKHRPPAEGAAGAPASSPPRSPAPSSAGTTIGRRAGARPRDAGAGAKPAARVGTPKEVKAPPPAQPSESAPSPSLGRRLLHLAKEAIV